VRAGTWTRERLVPLRESLRTEADPSRATQAYRVEERSALTPRGVGGVLDTAWEIFSTRFLGCVGVALALTIPMRAGLVAIRYSGVERVTRQALELGIELMAPLLIGVLVANLVGEVVQGRSTSTWASVRSTFDRLPSLLGILALLAIGQTCMGFLVCCFPFALYVYWQLSVAPAVYAIERRPLSQVFGRGLRLLKGWASFGRFLGTVVTHFCMFFGMGLSMAALDEPMVRAYVLELTSLDGLTLDLLATVPAAIFMAVSTAFLAIILTVYYFDVRARREGFDLELQLAELEQEHAEPGLEGSGRVREGGRA